MDKYYYYEKMRTEDYNLFPELLDIFDELELDKILLTLRVENEQTKDEQTEINEQKKNKKKKKKE